MDLENFGKNKIYRPSSQAEIENRKLVEKSFRKRYSVGVITEKEKINEILQYEFNYYEQILKTELPKIASRDLMDFVLYQFDEASKTEDKHKNYELTENESLSWKELGPYFRRTIKYLAESLVFLAPPEVPDAPTDELEMILDKCWIACEEMVKMYGLSDQSYSVFSDKTVLEILPEGEIDYFTLKLTEDIDFQENIRVDTFNRTKILGDSKEFYQFKLDHHSKILESAFLEAIGINYQEALSLLFNIINHCDPAPNGFPVLFVNKDKLIEATEKATSIKRDIIEKVISGFTICKSKMEKEGRELFKPKQEYRAFRRGFFEMPHKTGIHLAFSKEMAQECLFQLQLNTVFKQLPTEWLTENVKKSLEQIVAQSGKWFETFVAEKLKEIGFIGFTSVKKLKNANSNIMIPSEIGEIDYIGFSGTEKALLIAECKFVRPSFENAFFRDDLSEFVLKKKSYLAKYSKKVDWLKKNYKTVIEFFIEEGIVKKSNLPNKLYTVIITFYPNIAEYFIPEYPCISLTRLILDFRKDNKWFYSRGIFTI